MAILHGVSCKQLVGDYMAFSCDFLMSVTQTKQIFNDKYSASSPMIFRCVLQEGKVN